MRYRNTVIPVAILAALLVLICAGSCFGYYRMLVEQSNRPYEFRQYTYVAPEAVDEPRHMWKTGMGMSGCTENGPGKELGIITMGDNDSIRPPIMYHLQDYPDRTAPIDLLQHWVYFSDFKIHGQYGVHGKVVGQTFTATGDNLAKMGIIMAGDMKNYVVTVHEDSLDGPQIGSTKTIYGGKSVWNHIEYLPDEIKTVPGHTYAVKIVAEDGSEASPFIDSTGNIYDLGMAYFDGQPYPDRELIILIAMEDDGFVKHMPAGSLDHEGYQSTPDGYHFIARGENALFTYLRVKMKHPGIFEAHGGKVKGTWYVVSIYEDKPNGKRVGSPVQTYTLIHSTQAHKEINDYKFHGLWAPDDARLVPGEKYVVRIETMDDRDGYDKRVPLPQGALVGGSVYGEIKANSHPSISDVRTGEVTRDSIEVLWKKGNDSHTTIEYGKIGGKILGSVEEAGNGRAVIHCLVPNQGYQFRLISRIKGGCEYRSPWYAAATTKADGSESDVQVWRDDVTDLEKVFMPVAPGPIYRD